MHGTRLSVVAACCAALGGASPCRAADDALLPPGLYRSLSADVVDTGRACGNGAPLVPAFVLRVAPTPMIAAPNAAAVLRDGLGVAMPVTRDDGGAWRLADPTEPPPGNAQGHIVVLQREPVPWIAVDYRYLDADCRVSGTVVLEAIDDPALATQLDRLVDAFEASADRDRLRAAGRFRDAIVPGDAARSAFESTLGSEHWLALNAGTNLASLYREIDAYTEARARFQDLIPRIAATMGADHFHVWRARQNLALVLWDQGDFDGAERILAAVSERYRTLLGDDDPAALGTRINLATLVSLRGRLVEGERIMFDVLQRMERVHGPDHPRTLVALNNLAHFLDSAGRVDDALIHLATAVDRYTRTLGPQHPATLRAQHNRYAMLSRRGERIAALEGLERVYRGRREALGPNHSETLQSQHILATMLADHGRIAEALEMQRSAAAGRVAAHGPQHRDALLAQALLGELELRNGDVAGGLVRLRDAHAAAAQALGRDDRSTLLIGVRRGLSERDAGDLDAARATLTDVVESVERWRETAALTSSARRDVFASWVPAYKALVAVELALGNPRRAFEQVERSKARVLVETLSLRRGEASGVLPPGDLAALSALETTLAAVEAEIAKAPRDASARLPLEQRRVQLAGETAALRASLRDRHPKYAALSAPRLVDATEGARELPERSAFAHYVRDGDRVLVFTLDRRGRVVGRDLGAWPGLDDAIVAFRTLVAAPDASAAPPVWRHPDGRYTVALARPEGAVRVTDANVIGAELAERLVLPVPELMRTRRWIVSPDGALALLPFEALPHRGRPLVVDREIVYAPSLTVFALTNERGRDYRRRSDRGALYGMGAAIYDASASARGEAHALPAGLDAALANDPQGVRRAYDAMGAKWPNLPASARELDEVASRFAGGGGITLRRGPEATEARLKADDRSGVLSRHRYVLLSAHGYLSTEAPSLSAIVLGQADVTQEFDGYVTAAEWTGYTLRSDLIVLSACETGVGRLIAGEGVAGLPYALFVAGNRNVLLTLWPVADASTAQFVSRFFAHVRAGRPQATALAMTKREFASGKRYAAPLYWAPFVLYGS